MFSTRYFCFAAFLSLAFLPRAGAGENKPKVNPDTDIAVVLRFSVKELDPLKPGDSYVECVLRNDGKKAVQVPTRYGGGYESYMSLTTGMYYGLRLVFWAGEKKQETKLLKPGESTTIFKEALRDVLLLDYDREKPLKPNEKRYYWTWSA